MSKYHAIKLWKDNEIIGVVEVPDNYVSWVTYTEHFDSAVWCQEISLAEYETYREFKLFPIFKHARCTTIAVSAYVYDPRYYNLVEGVPHRYREPRIIIV